jgi:hypothetical protein
MSHPEEADRFDENPPSTPGENNNATSVPSTPGRSRGTSGTGSFLRGAGRRFSTSGMPLGFFQASGQVVSSAPSLSDIQNGNLDGDGWSGVGQRRNSVAHRDIDYQVLNNIALERTPTGLSVQRRYSQIAEVPSKESPAVPSDARPISETPEIELTEQTKAAALGEKAISDGGDSSTAGKADVVAPHDPSVPYPNGYQFPPKHTKWQSVQIGLKAYWKFLWTWFGFLLTIYALNVVAWGGMLFLVLIGGADKYSTLYPQPKLLPY